MNAAKPQHATGAKSKKSYYKEGEIYLESLSHGVHTFSESTSGWFAVAFQAGGQEAAGAAATFLHKKSKDTSSIQS